MSVYQGIYPGAELQGGEDLVENHMDMKEDLLFTADSPLGFSNFDLLLIERRSPRLSCCLMTVCSDPF